jgi:hypothetical protein
MSQTLSDDNKALILAQLHIYTHSGRRCDNPSVQLMRVFSLYYA